jgi:hypothetical protein
MKGVCVVGCVRRGVCVKSMCGWTDLGRIQEIYVVESATGYVDQQSGSTGEVSFIHEYGDILSPAPRCKLASLHHSYRHDESLCLR